MAGTQTSRNNLESFFKAGEIPREENFADLIASGINQKDDGLSKSLIDPLMLQAGQGGANSAQEEVLRLYSDLNDIPHWVFSMKPKPESGKRGLNISNGEGNSRLYIDESTGSVGIGTQDPIAALEVKNNRGDVYKLAYANTGLQGGNESGNLHIDSSSPKDFSDLPGEWNNGGLYLNHYSRNNTYMNLRGGNVGIGSSNPKAKLHLAGELYAKGHIFLHAHEGDEKSGNVYIQARDIKEGGSDSSIEMRFRTQNKGAVVEALHIDKDGNVGIGVSDPKHKLHIAGNVNISGALTPGAGNSENRGIMFPKDPGGGSGDSAFIRYFARTGENMTLRIGVGNDGGDHISLMASGHVGVGTDDPKRPLHVIGQIAFQAGANNSNAKKFLQGMPNRTVLFGGVWNQTLYFYSRDEQGRIRFHTIGGKAF